MSLLRADHFPPSGETPPDNQETFRAGPVFAASSRSMQRRESVRLPVGLGASICTWPPCRLRPDDLTGDFACRVLTPAQLGWRGSSALRRRSLGAAFFLYRGTRAHVITRSPASLRPCWRKRGSPSALPGFCPLLLWTSRRKQGATGIRAE